VSASHRPAPTGWAVLPKPQIVPPLPGGRSPSHNSQLASRRACISAVGAPSAHDRLPPVDPFAVRLSTTYQLAISPLELKAFLDPRMRKDPKVHRQIRANHIQATWDGGMEVAGAAVTIQGNDEPLSLTALRSAATYPGSATDFAWLKPA
jgi:hypothetical protein